MFTKINTYYFKISKYISSFLSHLICIVWRGEIAWAIKKLLPHFCRKIVGAFLLQLSIVHPLTIPADSPTLWSGHSSFAPSSWINEIMFALIYAQETCVLHLVLLSPLECPNNILKTLRWPWFRPKGGKRIEWVRLFGFRRNLSLVMIGLVWKADGPKCLHGFLTNGWKRWLATQPGRLHPLIFLHILYCSVDVLMRVFTFFNHFNQSILCKLRSNLLLRISWGLTTIISLFWNCLKFQ